MAKLEELIVEQVALPDLTLDPRNARKGNISKIIESLREFGQHRPVVARRDTHVIIVGNHMYQGMQALGWETCAVVFVDDSDIEATRRSLADNATNDKAGWDESLLAALLGEVGPVPGYDEDDIRKLNEKLAPPKLEDDPLFPILVRPNEEYDFVMVVATNQTDCNFLRDKFQIRNEKSYKRDLIAPAHIISVERLQELWGK